MKSRVLQLEKPIYLHHAKVGYHTLLDSLCPTCMTSFDFVRHLRDKEFVNGGLSELSEVWFPVANEYGTRKFESCTVIEARGGSGFCMVHLNNREVFWMRQVPPDWDGILVPETGRIAHGEWELRGEDIVIKINELYIIDRD